MSWTVPSPAHKYGGALAKEPVASKDDTENHVKAAGPLPAASHLDVRSPLFVFGVLAAATVGLMAYSTTVRVGPVKADLSLGK